MSDSRDAAPQPPASTSDATALAAEVVDRLAGFVTDVVVCPGSRNTPLTLALTARRDLRVHVRVDERSAAFLALGLARAQRRRVAVCMTSGTAVANCLPAVVEAAQSHTPLVVLAADRPARLVGTGASQTIVQRGLFGGYAPTLQVDHVGVGEGAAAQIDAFLAAHPQAHLNVALDNPLVPAAAPEPVGGPRATRPRPVTPGVDHGEVAVDLTRDTLVIAGDEAWEVPGLEEVPTIAEPSAPAPLNPVHPLAAAVLRPEQVIVVGHPTLHRAVLRLAAGVLDDVAPAGAGGSAAAPAVVVLSRTETVTDPEGAASRVGSRVRTSGAPRREWLAACERASQLAAEAVRAGLADSGYGFTGLHVAAAVADELGDGDTLFAAASNPVRDLSWVGLPFAGVRTLTPRGAAGIDGSVSQAVGAALAAQAEHPELPTAPRTVALLGDLAFLHDVGGLLIGPDEPRPENLTIVVANDDGGGIFESLEIGAPGLRPGFERAFATPTGVDLGGVCAAYGVEHARVGNLGELVDALVDAAGHPRFHVIEARTTRATRRALTETVQNVAVRAVGEGA
ncbi:2-succinyl-5-enolpyruvyl-6-hydroxy-3-cyclohexene-1-carboxylic-acid synthase [Corynebacterium frankenforstense]